ncbi:MAG: hypothetical protein QOH21_2324 [Acidobacteriota bacterium]|nr:hypothetical protein [Acidobacteriota bacterium]
MWRPGHRAPSADSKQEIPEPVRPSDADRQSEGGGYPSRGYRSSTDARVDRRGGGSNYPSRGYSGGR